MYELIAIFSSGKTSSCGKASLIEVKEFINRVKCGSTIFVIKEVQDETK